MVGKYVELPDAYISVTEALKHAGYPADSDIELDWVNANDLDDSNAAARLKDAHGIIVIAGLVNVDQKVKFRLSVMHVKTTFQCWGSVWVCK